MKYFKNLSSSQRALIYLFRRHRRVFLTEIGLVLLAMIPMSLMTLMPARIASAVYAGNTHSLLLNSVVFFLLGAIHGIIWNQADLHYTRRTYPLFYDLSQEAFEYAIGKKYPEYIAKSPSKIAQYTNELRDNVDRIWSSIHWGYIGFAFQVPAVMLISLKVSWIQSLIYFFCVVLMVVVLARRSGKLTVLMDRLYSQDSNLNSTVIDSVTNFVNVKSFNAEHKEHDLYAKLLVKSKEKFTIAFTDFMQFWFAASIVIRFVAWPLILASTYWLYASKRINAEQVVLAMSVLVSLTEFIWNVVDKIANTKKDLSKLQNGYAYLTGEESMFERKPEADKEVPTIVPVFNHDITLRNLDFAYPDRPDEFVLKNLNLTINKNEKIGVVGKSGGGKSTLVKLLLGFYDFEPGSILVDGQAVSKRELSLLNSYVPQDTSLFQQTIRFNIAYARSGPASDAEIEQAAKKAHAHEFISHLKDGYDTLVGERGVKLSLGQRQRIAIARAFLKNSDLLILDEATSALDSKTEAQIQDALEDLWHDKTVIAIAHRLSTLNNVDRVVVIENGTIAEVGTKQQLLKKDGVFAGLWHQQKNGLL